MINTIDGLMLYEMLKNGIANVKKNKSKLNDLNVFPVPDGDTGTNMFMTLKFGLDNSKNDQKNLGEVIGQFATSAVFGARGNSGVILSQFFKGLADGFKTYEKADVDCITKALENGTKYAYLSVAKPVEGTMLTVIREATEAVKQAKSLNCVMELLKVFVSQAKDTLDRTPQMLPILKKANVVDSGGCGIVCFFEGMLGYLTGEKISDSEETDQNNLIDFSLINKDTPLNYGYCVEGLVQLGFDEKDFCIEEFREKLTGYGNSIVASIEKDKIKLHVHTKKLAKVMEFCQKYGEFLTIKIENMSVQNILKQKEENKKFLIANELGENFNVIAVATNAYMQNKFIEMGADVVILSDITPSSQDFLTAFSYIDKDIIIFPNSANSILAAVQAAGLCPDKNITVVNSRSVADCYSALSVLDFDTNAKEAAVSINQSINALYKVFVYHSQKDIKYNGIKIEKNQFFSLENNENILFVDETIEKVALSTVGDVVDKKGSSVVTIVYADEIAEEFVEYLTDKIYALNLGVEVASVCSMESAYSLILVFE